MSWPRAELLQSERLSLEPLAVAHAGEMVTVLASPELYRTTGGQPPTLEELRARFTRQSRGQSEDGGAGWLNWIVRPASGGPAIGFVQATLGHAEGGRTADLAWLVAPAEQGRGFAAEAASAVKTWLHAVDVRHVRTFIHPEHTASMRVARRIGLAPTSTSVDGETLWEGILPAAGPEPPLSCGTADRDHSRAGRGSPPPPPAS